MLHVAQDKVQWRAYVTTGSVNAGNFLTCRATISLSRGISVHVIIIIITTTTTTTTTTTNNNNSSSSSSTTTSTTISVPVQKICIVTSETTWRHYVP
jgi:hypothetical protein